jgi:hypothetical protein
MRRRLALHCAALYAPPPSSTLPASSAPLASTLVTSTHRRTSIRRSSREMFVQKEHVANVCFKCFILMLQKYIGMFHILQWLYAYVSSVCSKCFIYSRGMLQVFLSKCCKSRSGYCIYTHVAKRMFQVFHTSVVSV